MSSFAEAAARAPHDLHVALENWFNARGSEDPATVTDHFDAAFRLISPTGKVVANPGFVGAVPGMRGSRPGLKMEIADVDDTAKAQGLFLKHGIDREHPLSSLLDAEYKAKLDSATKAMGLPVGSLEVFKPWMAGLTLTMAPLVKAGYDPQSGVELILKSEALKAKKPVNGFETLEQQVMFFATLEPSIQMAFLKETLDDYDNAATQLDGLAASWVKGDVKSIERDMIRPMRKESPGLYKVLLADRNADWARQIKARLAGKGVTFVAVGAAHLAGPDSVQNQLKKLGVRAKLY